MINSYGGEPGEHEPVMGHIERLTSGVSSTPLTLKDHPLYGSMAVSPSRGLDGDEVVGRRFQVRGRAVSAGVLEQIDLVRLDQQGLELVSSVDANACPTSLEVAFLEQNCHIAWLARLASASVYMDNVGKIIVVTTVQHRPVLPPEIINLFETRLRDWGLETYYTGLNGAAQVHVRMASGWGRRMSSLLSVF